MNLRHFFLTMPLLSMFQLTHAITPPLNEGVPNTTANSSKHLTLSSILKPISTETVLDAGSLRYTFSGATADTINYIRLCSATDNTCANCSAPLTVITAGTPIPYSTSGTTYGISPASIAAYLSANGFAAGNYNVGMYVQSSNEHCSSSYCSTNTDTERASHRLCMQATYNGAGNVTALSQADNGNAILNVATSLFAYVADGSGNLWQCPLNSTGGISGLCTALTTNQGFASINSVVFNIFSGTTYGYIADGTNQLWQCPMSAVGNFSSTCISLGSNVFTSNGPVGLTFHTFSGTTYVYVAAVSYDLIQCPMDATGGIVDSACTSLSITTGSTSATLTYSTTFYTFSGITYAYVADLSSTLWRCPIDATTGGFSSTCTQLTNSTSPGFKTTNAVTFRTFSGITYAYVGDSSANLWKCPMDATGGLNGGCIALTPSLFSSTSAATFNTFAGTIYAYVGDSSTNLWQCTMDAAGNFSGSCVPYSNTPSFNSTQSATFCPYINLTMAAAGQYNSTAAGHPNYPLLATSANKGASWTYTLYSTTPSIPGDYLNNGIFNNVICAGLNCVAGGQYQSTNAGTPNYPLLATSADSGATWAYTLDGTTSPSVPGDYYNNGTINGVSCTGLNCIGAGDYQNTAAGNPTYPLLVSSTNGGITWAYTLNSTTTPSVPGDYKNNAVLTSISCSNPNCVAAGHYQSTAAGNPFYPLLVTSTNNGATWTYTLDSTTTPSVPADYLNNAVLSSISCFGTQCVAAGHYQSTTAGNPTYPLLITSADSGVTWSYTLDSATSPSVPGAYDNGGAFSSVSCNGLICVAVGQYQNTAAGNPYYPMAAMSSDGGTTWSYSIDSTTTPAVPGDYVNNGIFNSVSCNNLYCVAAGQYQSSTSAFPLLATSADGGTTWTYTLYSSSVPADYLNNGVFNSITCAGLNCIAAGQYQSTNPGHPTYPLLATSTDGGATWAYTLDSTTIPSVPLDYYNSGTLYGDGSNTLSTLLPNVLRALLY